MKAFTPGDLFFLYFALHGSRDSCKQSRWPDLHFPFEKTQFDFGSFVEIAKKKNPRLLIALADSCNVQRGNSAFENEPDEISEEEIVEMLMKDFSGPTIRYIAEKLDSREILALSEEVKAAYKKLFVDPFGRIIISSSSPGFAAVRDFAVTGGLFTRIFLEMLVKEIQQFAFIDEDQPLPIPSWQTLLCNACKKTNEEASTAYLFEPPKPQFELLIN